MEEFRFKAKLVNVAALAFGESRLIPIENYRFYHVIKTETGKMLFVT